jgi:hypothetical protein
MEMKFDFSEKRVELDKIRYRGPEPVPGQFTYTTIKAKVTSSWKFSIHHDQSISNQFLDSFHTPRSKQQLPVPGKFPYTTIKALVTSSWTVSIHHIQSKSYQFLEIFHTPRSKQK